MTAKKRALGSDLAKVDAHRITPEEYEEIPEFSEEDFAAADLYHGTTLVRRGRPKLEQVKEHVSLRLSPEVVKVFRQTGKGWQGRIDTALKVFLTEHPVSDADQPFAIDLKA